MAHNKCDEWTRFWIHTGHLHIDGCKMSKSLKNFISIKDYIRFGWSASPADDLRIYFLHHKYHSTLHFSKDRIMEAGGYRQRVDAFLELTKKLQLENGNRCAVRCIETRETIELKRKLLVSQKAVHSALCSDFDTPTVMNVVADLISTAMPALRAALADQSVPVNSIYATKKMIQKLLGTFGLRFVQVGCLYITYSV